MTCIYRHCLPPGYVMKKPKKLEDMTDDTGLEETLDEQINKLNNSQGTPVTLERFNKWKEEKRIERELEREKKQKEEIKKAAGGKSHGLTGKSLF